jgi:transcriptional regulator with XRE-family HTH domain
MNLTQQQFAVRLRVTPVSLGRYETSRPPSGKILERLHRIAQKQGHPSAKVFAAFLEQTKRFAEQLRRIGQIQDTFNLHAANEQLQLAWMDSRDRMEGAEPDSLPAAQLLLDVCERQRLQIREHLRKLADLIAIGGRKELFKEEIEQ